MVSLTLVKLVGFFAAACAPLRESGDTDQSLLTSRIIWVPIRVAKGKYSLLNDGFRGRLSVGTQDQFLALSPDATSLLRGEKCLEKLLAVVPSQLVREENRLRREIRLCGFSKKEGFFCFQLQKLLVEKGT